MLAGILKVSKAPLPSPNGYGKPLGNKNGNNLTGFFKITENDCYMYKIQDVSLTMTLIERIFKLSTITCHTGDTTNPILVLKHIKNGRAIKEFLLQASDEARLKRRTINTLNIGADDIEEEL